MGLAVAGILAKPAISAVSNLINPSKAYEAKMSPEWAAGADKAVEAHRKVGSPPNVWNGALQAAPKGFASYLPGDIWNPNAVTAAAGNRIAGCTVQGPRPSGMSEQEWLTRDPSKYPYPSTGASSAPEALGSNAAPLLAGSGSSSLIWIVAIAALVLFTRIKK